MRIPDRPIFASAAEDGAVKVSVSKGPSLYYVRIFLDFFWPTYYVNINTAMNVGQNGYFPNPPTRSVWWRNVGMVPNIMLLAVIAMLHFQNFKLQETKLDYVCLNMNDLKKPWNAISSNNQRIFLLIKTTEYVQYFQLWDISKFESPSVDDNKVFKILPFDFLLKLLHS